MSLKIFIYAGCVFCSKSAWRKRQIIILAASIHYYFVIRKNFARLPEIPLIICRFCCIFKISFQFLPCLSCIFHLRHCMRHLDHRRIVPNPSLHQNFRLRKSKRVAHRFISVHKLHIHCQIIGYLNSGRNCQRYFNCILLSLCVCGFLSLNNRAVFSFPYPGIASHVSACLIRYTGPSQERIHKRMRHVQIYLTYIAVIHCRHRFVDMYAFSADPFILQRRQRVALCVFRFDYFDSYECRIFYLVKYRNMSVLPSRRVGNVRTPGRNGVSLQISHIAVAVQVFGLSHLLSRYVAVHLLPVCNVFRALTRIVTHRLITGCINITFRNRTVNSSRYISKTSDLIIFHRKLKVKVIVCLQFSISRFKLQFSCSRFHLSIHTIVRKTGTLQGLLIVYVLTWVIHQHFQRIIVCGKLRRNCNAFNFSRCSSAAFCFFSRGCLLKYLHAGSRYDLICMILYRAAFSSVFACRIKNFQTNSGYARSRFFPQNFSNGNVMGQTLQ